MAFLRGWVLFMLAGFIGAVVTALFRWPPHQSSDWAAWVQAVGSIGAIGVAIFVSWDQRKNDRSRERARIAADDDDVLMNVEVILKNAVQLLGEMPDRNTPVESIKRYFETEFSTIKMKLATQALAGIELNKLKWWRAIEVVLEMRRLFATSEEAVMAVKGDLGRYPHRDIWRTSLDQITASKESAPLIVAAIGKLRAEVRKQAETSV